MTLKEKLIQEIEQVPDPLISQVLDFLLFIKDRYIEEEVTEEEHANILASQIAYESGDFLILDQYEASKA